MDFSLLEDNFYGGNGKSNGKQQQKPQQRKQENYRPQQQPSQMKRQQYNHPQKQSQQPQLQEDEKNKVAAMMEDLIGTRGAYVLDSDLNILGKVPSSELISTIKNLNSGIYAVALDGVVEKEHISAAEKANIKFIIGMDKKSKSQKVTVMTAEEI